MHHVDLPAAADEPASGVPWYKLLTRYHWFVLVVAALGWLFDCLDQQLFILARPAAMKELIPDGAFSDPKALDLARRQGGDIATSIFIAGWATGGLIFGMLGDRIGRAKTMIITILMYSLFTGLSSISTGLWDFALYRFLTGLAFGKLSLPPFMVAILLIYLFAVSLNLLPATGWVPFAEDPVANLRSLVLPALTLAIAEWPVLMRVLRSDMIATLQEDYIAMAKAKGLRPARILLVHALKPSSLTLVTVTGINIGRLIGGYAAAGVDEFIVPDFALGRGNERLDAFDRFLTEVAASFR